MPIGVDYDRIQAIAADPALAAEQQRLVELFGLRADIIGIGVDRLDYTKGIPERLAALDARADAAAGAARTADVRADRRAVTIGAGELRRDRGRDRPGDRRAERAPHGARRPAGGPATTRAPLTIVSLVALYRLAHFCIVSSLHDGMNLVAKEFVAARDDEDGVLVLSALAGAAQELQDALIINPYDVDGFADALIRAIDMPRDERARAHARDAARRRRPRTCSAGRRTSSRASRACGPSRCTTRFAASEDAPV